MNLSWTLTALIGATDYTARVTGRAWRQQTPSGEHLCRLDIVPPSGAVDAGALIGEPLVLTATVNGATSERFRGVVDTADYDGAANLLHIQASDGLRALFEACETDAQVLAILPGARLNEAAHKPWTDGWRRGLQALDTLPASIAVCRDQQVRVTPWARAGSADVTLAASDTRAGSGRVTRRARPERTNLCRVTVEVRVAIRHHWELASGFALSGATFCDWSDADSPRPLAVSQIDSAVRGCGALLAPTGTLSAAPGGTGIYYTLLPPSGSYVCGGANRPHANDAPGVYAIGAKWTWAIQWLQTATLRYALTVRAPDSQAKYGDQVRDDSASVDTSTDRSDYGATTAGGTLSRPADVSPAGGGGGGYRAVDIDAGAEAALIEVMLAEEAVAILEDHRDEALISLVPTAAALAVDLHHTVAATWDRGTCTARVGGITEWWDVESGDAQIDLLLRPSQCPGAGGTDTARTAPSRPSIPAEYTLTGERSETVRIGGAAADPAYSGDWLGVTTNKQGVTYPEEGATEYPVRIALERPAVPDAARDHLEVAAEAEYLVYPPHDPLTEFAP